MDADGGARANAQGSTFERDRRGLIAYNSTGSSVGGLNVIKTYALVKLILIHTHAHTHTQTHAILSESYHAVTEDEVCV